MWQQVLMCSLHFLSPHWLCKQNCSNSFIKHFKLVKLVDSLSQNLCLLVTSAKDEGMTVSVVYILVNQFGMVAKEYATDFLESEQL